MALPREFDGEVISHLDVQRCASKYFSLREDGVDTEAALWESHIYEIISLRTLLGDPLPPELNNLMKKGDTSSVDAVVRALHAYASKQVSKEGKDALFLRKPSDLGGGGSGAIGANGSGLEPDTKQPRQRGRSSAAHLKSDDSNGDQSSNGSSSSSEQSQQNGSSQKSSSSNAEESGGKASNSSSSTSSGLGQGSSSSRASSGKSGETGSGDSGDKKTTSGVTAENANSLSSSLSAPGTRTSDKSWSSLSRSVPSSGKTWKGVNKSDSSSEASSLSTKNEDTKSTNARPSSSREGSINEVRGGNSDASLGSQKGYEKLASEVVGRKSQRYSEDFFQKGAKPGQATGGPSSSKGAKYGGSALNELSGGGALHPQNPVAEGSSSAKEAEKGVGKKPKNLGQVTTTPSSKTGKDLVRDDAPSAIARGVDSLQGLQGTTSYQEAQFFTPLEVLGKRALQLLTGTHDELPDTAWDARKLTRLVITKRYTQIPTAKKKTRGRAAVLFLPDISPSCASFSAESLNMVASMRKLGLPGLDVLSVSHFNGVPIEYVKNGVQIYNGVDWYGSKYTDEREANDFYKEIIDENEVEYVIPLSDWDGFMTFCFIAAIPRVKKVIWLDGSRIREDRKEFFAENVAINTSYRDDLDSQRVSHLKRKTTYVPNIQNARHFVKTLIKIQEGKIKK